MIRLNCRMQMPEAAKGVDKTARCRNMVSRMTYVLTAYIEAAMTLANYDKLEDGSFAGEIKRLPGVIAFGKTLKQCEVIRKLRGLGFRGPFSGARHEFMIIRNHRQTLPSNIEYSVPQLRMLINQVQMILGREIPAEEWNSL